MSTKKSLLLFAAMSALVQTAAQNYVMTETFIDSNNNSIAAIDYYDGLGRPVQSVVTGSNTSTGYEYRLQSYDYVDRIAKQFITAYSNGTPEFKDSANLSWLYSDVDKSTRYQYDGLGRVTTKRGPGNLWRNGNHYNQTAYRINSVGEVRLFSISGNSLKQTNNASHAQGTLTKDVYDDENGNEMRVYKDLYDRVVLERRINDNTAYDTYYVYDNLGNLRYFLPPMTTDNLPTSGTWTMATSALKKYAYYYEYDSRGRCTKKQMPGCDYITMTYDNNDRLVASQDGNQRNASPVTSTYYEYDALGRQTVMGTKTAAGVKTPLLETFYDDYTFISSLSSTDQVKMTFNPIAGYHSSYAGAKGLQTGTRIHLLNTPAVSYVTAMYYDLLGNMIQSRSTNNKNGTDIDYIQYNEYTGKQMNRRHVHSPSGQTEYTETYSYTYDYADRLLNVKHKLNSNAQVTLCAYTYDELGRVKTRQLMDNVETVTYDYNIRDWQKKISSTQFKEYIGYNETSGDVIPTNKYYNGNIGAIKWKTGNETKMRGYEFTYNDLNWMTNASYRENGSANNRYDVNYWYDKMGNMIYMERMGLQDGGSFGYIDDLVLDYNGNQVTHINDNEDDPTYSGAFNFPDGSSATIEYTYDQNGNMTKDLNKKISSIQYNLLNLPQNVTFQNGKSVSYSYNALGEKSEATYNYLVAGMNYTYCSNFCYENGTLKQILIDGGYISLNGTTPTYHYYLQDHLGNNRVVCNASGTVEQVNHYYPFGGLYGESTNESTQRYKYNGKEFDRIHGLDWYDYGARHMSPDIGRFISIDPMAEKYYNLSPYAYCGNNPVNAIDPKGRDYWSTNDTNQIISFLNAIGRGQNQFDFSEWNHATDAEFVGKLTYNDETNKYYTSYAKVIDNEIHVIGRSFDASLIPVSEDGMGYSGAFVYQSFNRDFWVQANYYINGITYFDGLFKWKVNTSGRITGYAPIIGMAPMIGKGKSIVGGKQKMGHSIGKMSANRQVQKEQIESLIRKYKLTPSERRILHNEISHQGYGYHEIEELIIDLFK